MVYRNVTILTHHHLCISSTKILNILLFLLTPFSPYSNSLWIIIMSLRVPSLSLPMPRVLS